MIKSINHCPICYRSVYVHANRNGEPMYRCFECNYSVDGDVEGRIIFPVVVESFKKHTIQPIYLLSKSKTTQIKIFPYEPSYIFRITRFNIIDIESCIKYIDKCFKMISFK